MLMRGDLNKIIEEFNVVVEKAFERIQVLEDKVMELEKAKEPAKKPGRPKKDPEAF